MLREVKKLEYSKKYGNPDNPEEPYVHKEKENTHSCRSCVLYKRREECGRIPLWYYNKLAPINIMSETFLIIDWKIGFSYTYMFCIEISDFLFYACKHSLCFSGLFCNLFWVLQNQMVRVYARRELAKNSLFQEKRCRKICAGKIWREKLVRYKNLPELVATERKE